MNIWRLLGLRISQQSLVLKINNKSINKTSLLVFYNFIHRVPIYLITIKGCNAIKSSNAKHFSSFLTQEIAPHIAPTLADQVSALTESITMGNAPRALKTLDHLIGAYPYEKISHAISAAFVIAHKYSSHIKTSLETYLNKLPDDHKIMALKQSAEHDHEHGVMFIMESLPKTTVLHQKLAHAVHGEFGNAPGVMLVAAVKSNNLEVAATLLASLGEAIPDSYKRQALKQSATKNQLDFIPLILDSFPEKMRHKELQQSRECYAITLDVTYIIDPHHHHNMHLLQSTQQLGHLMDNHSNTYTDILQHWKSLKNSLAIGIDTDKQDIADLPRKLASNEKATRETHVKTLEKQRANENSTASAELAKPASYASRILHVLNKTNAGNRGH